MTNVTKTGAARKSASYTDDDWMSVPQAAKQLACAVQTVYNRALRGELETMRFAGRLFVSRASVEAAVERA